MYIAVPAHIEVIITFGGKKTEYAMYQSVLIGQQQRLT